MCVWIKVEFQMKKKFFVLYSIWLLNGFLFPVLFVILAVGFNFDFLLSFYRYIPFALARWRKKNKMQLLGKTTQLPHLSDKFTMKSPANGCHLWISFSILNRIKTTYSTPIAVIFSLQKSLEIAWTGRKCDVLRCNLRNPYVFIRS